MRLISLLLLAALAASSCGLKGPLYLPDEKAEPADSTAPGNKK